MINFRIINIYDGLIIYHLGIFVYIDPGSAAAYVGSNSSPQNPNVFGGQRFGQRPPPISKLIKDLLEKYPSGQIFKVCHTKWTIQLKSVMPLGFNYLVSLYYNIKPHPVP